jgi:thiol-disulfide isomerase/thioredoxin
MASHLPTKRGRQGASAPCSRQRGIAAVLALIGLVAWSCGGKRESPRISTGGAPVLTGEVARIDSLLAANRGKWVLLNIWATWCRPCVAETPALTALAHDLGGRPFALVGVSLDLLVTNAEATAVRKVAEFAGKYQVPYSNVVYTGSTDDLTGRFSLSGVIPTSILYDPEGHETDRWVGALIDDDLRRIRQRIS